MIFIERLQAHDGTRGSAASNLGTMPLSAAVRKAGRKARRNVSLITALLLMSGVAVATGISAQRQTQLIHLLREDCGSCHGMTLKGGLGSPLLPDKLAGKPDALLVDTILNGRPDTAMPPWRRELSRDEAAWLVEQLRRGFPEETP